VGPTGVIGSTACSPGPWTKKNILAAFAAGDPELGELALKLFGGWRLSHRVASRISPSPKSSTDALAPIAAGSALIQLAFSGEPILDIVTVFASALTVPLVCAPRDVLG
jgi:hypothetical protein